MTSQVMVQALKKVQVPISAGSSLLQRKGGKCGKKYKEMKGGGLHRSAVRASPEHVPPIVHEVLREPGRPLDAGTRSSMESPFRHDFSHVRVHTDKNAAKSARAVDATIYPACNAVVFGEGPSTKGAARQDECGKKCGGGELGSVECELDLKTGLPTDKVRKEVREKDECIRPCVDAHEEVHVKDIKPICKRVYQCLKEAMGDAKKTDTCLDRYETDSRAKIAGSGGTECHAYKAELQCMKKQESAPACKTKEGKARWTSHSARTKCYEDCYCRK